MTKKTSLFYRLQQDESIRNGSFLLILDGAKYHISFLSTYLFYIFNIDLLLIPPHTSHILSPFDVSLASHFQKFFLTIFMPIKL